MKIAPKEALIPPKAVFSIPQAKTKPTRGRSHGRQGEDLDSPERLPMQDLSRSLTSAPWGAGPRVHTARGLRPVSGVLPWLKGGDTWTCRVRTSVSISCQGTEKYLQPLSGRRDRGKPRQLRIRYWSRDVGSYRECHPLPNKEKSWVSTSLFGTQRHEVFCGWRSWDKQVS